MIVFLLEADVLLRRSFFNNYSERDFRLLRFVLGYANYRYEFTKVTEKNIVFSNFTNTIDRNLTCSSQINLEVTNNFHHRFNEPTR